MPEPIDRRTDAELMAALRDADTSAFDTLYRRHRDWVVRMAMRITGDEADALDVLQEAFLYLLRKAPDLEARARFSTLLFPIVRHVALARRRNRIGSVAAPEPTVEPADTARHEELVAVLAGLPVEQRETVLLRFVDGLSVAEVAMRLGVPVGTVKWRLHEALERLREDPRARHYFLG